MISSSSHRAGNSSMVKMEGRAKVRFVRGDVGGERGRWRGAWCQMARGTYQVNTDQHIPVSFFSTLTITPTSAISSQSHLPSYTSCYHWSKCEWAASIYINILDSYDLLVGSLSALLFSYLFPTLNGLATSKCNLAKFVLGSSPNCKLEGIWCVVDYSLLQYGVKLSFCSIFAT